MYFTKCLAATVLHTSYTWHAKTFGTHNEPTDNDSDNKGVDDDGNFMMSENDDDRHDTEQGEMNTIRFSIQYTLSLLY